MTRVTDIFRKLGDDMGAKAHADRAERIEALIQRALEARLREGQKAEVR